VPYNNRTMAVNRMEALRSMLEQDPANSFARYGLAQEYANSGELTLAVEEYAALIGHDPGYCAAYYHGGQALQRLGRTGEARDYYQRGIEAAVRKGDAHTQSELKEALDTLL